jgi:broad specificity polyphosphatase/5'/3'-nucleotidase SurE
VEGTDLAALAANKISVTPLSLDLTNERVATQLAGVFADAPKPKSQRPEAK